MALTFVRVPEHLDAGKAFFTELAARSTACSKLIVSLKSALLAPMASFFGVTSPASTLNRQALCVYFHENALRVTGAFNTNS